mmetsp:Transcript_22098/g.61928  ORF Transcript_22098/g.61928 Transcript_22098/m.61928 type:complete len:346 (+) Transcript_22098:3005-4042(+)
MPIARRFGRCQLDGAAVLRLCPRHRPALLPGRPLRVRGGHQASLHARFWGSEVCDKAHDETLCIEDEGCGARGGARLPSGGPRLRRGAAEGHAPVGHLRRHGGERDGGAGRRPREGARARRRLRAVRRGAQEPARDLQGRGDGGAPAGLPVDVLGRAARVRGGGGRAPAQRGGVGGAAAGRRGAACPGAVPHAGGAPRGVLPAGQRRGRADRQRRGVRGRDHSLRVPRPGGLRPARHRPEKLFDGGGAERLRGPGDAGHAPPSRVQQHVRIQLCRPVAGRPVRSQIMGGEHTMSLVSLGDFALPALLLMEAWARSLVIRFPGAQLTLWLSVYARGRMSQQSLLRF